MARRSDASRWLAEDSAFEVLELSRGAGRDLVANGLLQPRQDGIFRERDIAEGTIVKSARSSLGRIGEASNAWSALRERGAVDAMLDLAGSQEAERRFEIIIDDLTRTVTAAVDDEQLIAAVRGSLRRQLVVLDLTDELRTRLTAFRNRANRGPVPAKRRGRPRKTAEVHAFPSTVAGDG